MSNLTQISKNVSYVNITLTQFAHFDIHQIVFSKNKILAKNITKHKKIPKCYTNAIKTTQLS